MATYTATPLDSSTPPLPMSSGVPFGTNTTTPTEMGPINANSGNPVAPVSMYVKDGNDLTLGLSTQTKATDGSTTSWSVIQLLKGIIDKLLNTVAVTQSGTWTQVPNAATTGGSTPSHTMSAASTNATSLKATAGQVYGLTISNANAAARYFKLYNKASAPTVGTDTPVLTLQVPGNGTVIRAYPAGLALGTGIAWAATGGIANADTTAIGANDLSIDIDYL